MEDEVEVESWLERNNNFVVKLPNTDYYDKKEDKGFDYAYRDPGMNKVMQAVGRLIRSESDRGAALLIDDRYMTEEYRSLFRRIWDEYEVVTSPSDVTDSLREFYQGEKAKD